MNIDTTQHLLAAIEGVQAEHDAAAEGSERRWLLDLALKLLTQAEALREQARGREAPSPPLRCKHCGETLPRVTCCTDPQCRDYWNL